MNMKRQQFADLYLANGFNAREAYWEVYGHRDKKYPSAAYDILHADEVQAYVKARRKELYDSLNIDAMRVMAEIAELAFEPTDKDNKTSKLKALELLSKNLSLQTVKTENKDVIEVQLIQEEE